MALLPTGPAPTLPTGAAPGASREGKILLHVTPEESKLLDGWAARADKPLAVLVREAALAAATRGA